MGLGTNGLAVVAVCVIRGASVRTSQIVSFGAKGQRPGNCEACCAESLSENVFQDGLERIGVTPRYSHEAHAHEAPDHELFPEGELDVPHYDEGQERAEEVGKDGICCGKQCVSQL